VKKYLLDTNTVIYALNQSFKFPKNRYLISVITEIELLSFSKLTKEDEDLLKVVLSNFESIDLTQNIKSKTIEIRKKSMLKLPDSLIVASAIVENATLVTSDKQLLNFNGVDTMELKDVI
jgi:hypothetical protein